MSPRLMFGSIEPVGMKAGRKPKKPKLNQKIASPMTAVTTHATDGR